MARLPGISSAPGQRDVGVRRVLPVLVLRVQRHAGLDQEAVGDRRRPRALIRLHFDGGIDRRLRHHVERARQRAADQEAVPLVVVVVVEEGQLVARRRLGRQADGGRLRELVVDRLLVRRRVQQVARVRVEEHVGDVLVGPLRRVAGPEPEAVADDRAAKRRVDEPQLAQAVRLVLADATSDELVAHVVGLQVGRREAGEELARPVVAAVARDHVDAHAARLDLGGVARVVDRVFGVVAVGEEHVRRVAVAGDRFHAHAVDLHHLVLALAAVDRQPLVVDAALAADVHRQRRADHAVTDHAGNQDPQVLERLAARNGVDDVAIDSGVLLDVGDVYRRRGAGDGNRFLDRADRQLCVDVGLEAGAQDDPFAQDR